MSGVFYVILLSSSARGGLYCYLWGWSCWCRCGPPGHAWTQWWEAWFRCCPLALCDHSSACRAEEFFSEEALMPPGKWGTRGGGGCPTLLCLQEETRQAHDLKRLKRFALVFTVGTNKSQENNFYVYVKPSSHYYASLLHNYYSSHFMAIHQGGEELFQSGQKPVNWLIIQHFHT